MKIGAREIGQEELPYIIAEIGVNHDGSPDRALELIEHAAQAGADAVKLQYFRADMLMSRAAVLAEYQRDAGEHDPIAMLKRLELGIDAMAALVDRAHLRGLHAVVTVFSLELVESAERLAWDAYKTASPDIIHRPLIEGLIHTGKPVIISTGASTEMEVGQAIGWLDGGRERAALLQCVSCYPTRDEDAALGGISALRRIFDGPVGYSDHTARIEMGRYARGLGACILEKHLTYDRAAPGPDHAASLDPDGFKMYCELARASIKDPGLHDGSALCGPELKLVLPCEEDVRRVSRQSIVAARSIERGEVIDPSALTFKRPGIGVPPWRIADLVGHRAARAICVDELLTLEDAA